MEWNNIFRQKIMRQLIGIIFLWLSVFQLQAQNPIIKFDTTVIDFGTVIQGSNATKVFTYYNVGNAPLSIINIRQPGSNYTCDLLTSAESIILQTDPNDDLIDNEDYRRLLAWIWVKLPGEEEYFLLNYMVVAQGLAQVKYEFGSGETIMYGDYTYNEWMHIGEDSAIENEYGQWGTLLDPYWIYD